MAFIDIKDPTKREEIVKDYIKNLREIHEKVENEKVQGLAQSREIAKVFQPVVQATEKSSDQITNEIKTLKEETIPEVKNEQPSSLKYFLSKYNKSKLDTHFGIQEKDGVYTMGDKEVVIDDESNIHLDDGKTTFLNSKGLWRLIMENKPNPEFYTAKDFENYKQLINLTNAIHYPHMKNTTQRPRGTSKWAFFKEAGLVQGEPSGTGIQFLPSDINGLLDQLRLLYAEFRSGNKSSTRNIIIAILDQLLKRNVLNQEEYNAFCETLSC